MKVIITEKIHDAGIEILKGYFDTIIYAYNMGQEKFLEMCKQENVDAIVIRGIPYMVTRELIDATPNLKAIGANVINTSNVDEEYCKEKGIPVFNVPGGSSDAVAELAFAFMLNLSRKIVEADYSVRHLNTFNKHNFVGTMLKDKTLGIIALGRVGQRVARFAKAFDMKIVAYDPYHTQESAAEHGARLTSLDEVLAVSDFVSIHSPLTPETRNMFNERTIAKIKPGAYLVNVARGGVVDEDALAKAIESGKIAGAAIDAFAVEPPNYEHPLFSLPNVICTPHIGGSTEESQYLMGTTCCGRLVEYLKKIS